MEKRHPKVGVGVIVIKDGKVLVGKRREKYGRGSWSFPGGGLKFNESFEECAKRETREESNIEIKNPVFACVVNDRLDDSGKHYVTIYMKAEYFSGEPMVVDGEFERWEWCDWSDLPFPRFVPLENLLKMGYRP